MRTHSVIKVVLENALRDIGQAMGGYDAACIVSPLVSPVERELRDVIEARKDGRKKKIAIVLQTPGGTAKSVERMVGIIRRAYKEVAFIIPDSAMSAGTMLVMSGDRILMDNYSCLGPIDAQVVKNDNLISTSGYLRKFEEIVGRSQENKLTTADVMLLGRIDLGELEAYEQEQKLSVELLEKWLSKYKFKNWKKTATRKMEVTTEMRRKRAREIAETLGDNREWHSHARPIDIAALRKMKLLVEDYAKDVPLAEAVKRYFSLLSDFMQQEGIVSLIQLGECFYVDQRGR